LLVISQELLNRKMAESLEQAQHPEIKVADTHMDDEYDASTISDVKFEDVSRAKVKTTIATLGILRSNAADVVQSSSFLLAIQYRIADGVHQTPCELSTALSTMTNTTLYFKKEYLHHTGSFKERGARNALKMLTKEQKARGVIAASAGNHALG
jgi:hypothetical protein